MTFLARKTGINKNTKKVSRTSLASTVRRSFLFGLAGLLVATLFVPFISFSANAAPFDEATPADQAKSASYYRLLRDCVRNNMFDSIQLSGSDGGIAAPSKWFDNYSAYGYTFPNGKTDCKDAVGPALELWGWGDDYSAFLKSIGYTYDAGNAKWVGSSNGNTRQARFDSAVQSKYYGVNFAGDPVQSGAARYEMFVNAFKKACNAKDLGAISGIDNASYKAWLDQSTASKGTQVNSSRAGVNGMVNGNSSDYDVYFSKVSVVEQVDGEFKVVQHGYAYQTAFVAGDGWYGQGQSPLDGNVSLYGYWNRAVVRSCHEIQKGITENASAWLAWARAHPDAAVTAPTSQDGTTPTSASETPSSCAIEGVGWIVCPILNFLSRIADASFSFLATSFLETKPDVFNTTSPTYTAWTVMRSIANVLFVIAFLFIVFSQLTGVGITNYGVKKMLPRLVVAAILVNVSFFIAQLAIDISNILGYSIIDLFKSITNDVNSATLGSSAAQISDLATGGGGGFAQIGGAIIGTGLAIGTVYLLITAFLPILLAVVLALILILFILVARQAIIIFLVVLSPIAFVAFLLPNTESLFKQWRKMLTAMLLVFPIIALVFGVSILASSLLRNSFTGGVNGDGSNMWGQIIGSAILILPLFAVPILLKKSLDGIPMLGQLANKWANRAYSNAGNKTKEGYRNSYIGKGAAIRKNARQAYMDRKFAQGVDKGGPRAWAAKGLNVVTPKGRYTRNAVDRTAQEVAEKAFMSDINAMATAYRTKYKNPDTQIADVSKELANAIKRGGKDDIVKARAAQSILLESGGAGLDNLHKTLAKEMDEPGRRNGKVGESIRTGLNSAGLKGKNNVLATWAYTDAKIKDIERGEATTKDEKGNILPVKPFQDLNAVELAGQRPNVLRVAAETGQIAPAQAIDVLTNEATKKDLGPAKTAIFTSVAGVMFNPNETSPKESTDSNPSPTPNPGYTTPPAGGTPQPAPSPTSASSSSAPPTTPLTPPAASSPAPAAAPTPAPDWSELRVPHSEGQTTINIDNRGVGSMATPPVPMSARESQIQAKAIAHEVAKEQKMNEPVHGIFSGSDEESSDETPSES